MVDFIGAQVSEVGVIIYLLAQEEKKDWTGEAASKFHSWIKEFEHIKVEVSSKCLETSVYHFPRTNELGFINFMLENLKELVACEADSITSAKGQIQTDIGDLGLLKSFLQDIA